MTETQIGELLLYLSLFFALTYLLAGILEKIRIPGILGALFIAMAAHYTPVGRRLLSSEIYEPFSFLAQLGVLFLLFFIGLQIDLKEMRGLSRDIIWLTAPIVPGRRFRTRERLYVGSTTSAVISMSPAPVLVVPLGRKQRRP